MFLRSFGQNEFALPVFFENEEPVYCNDSLEMKGHLELVDLSSKNLVKLSEIYSDDYKVIHLPNVQDPEIQTLKNEINRILNTFDDVSLSIVSFQPLFSKDVDQIEAESFLLADRANTYLFSPDDKDFFVNCLYAFPTDEWDGKHPSEETLSIDHTLVLLDDENKIRGYYDGYETKEVDRLILEIRVLLSNK